LVRLDLKATRAHEKGPTVAEALRRRPVRDDELTGGVGKQLNWIPAGEMSA
jgi:hypothetical protein